MPAEKDSDGVASNGEDLPEGIAESTAERVARMAEAGRYLEERAATLREMSEAFAEVVPQINEFAALLELLVEKRVEIDDMRQLAGILDSDFFRAYQGPPDLTDASKIAEKLGERLLD